MRVAHDNIQFRSADKMLLKDSPDDENMRGLVDNEVYLLQDGDLLASQWQWCLH
jgi:hypothetical protein